MNIMCKPVPAYAEKREIRAQQIRTVYPGSKKTASSIAAMISEMTGETVTRNAIIGFYHKCRHMVEDCPLGPANVRTKQPKTKQEIQDKLNRKWERQKAKRQAAQPKLIVVEPELPSLKSAPFLMNDDATVGKLLWELGANECRWPVFGQRVETLFCAETATHGSYCMAHFLRSRPRVTA